MLDLNKWLLIPMSYLNIATYRSCYQFGLLCRVCLLTLVGAWVGVTSMYAQGTGRYGYTAGSDLIPTQYYGVPNNFKQIILGDEFVDNRNGWNLQDAYMHLSMEDGELQFDNPSIIAGNRCIKSPLQVSEDYEIEVKMRFVRGLYRNNSMGVIFGMDDHGNYHELSFTPEGKYKVATRKEGRTRDLMAWRRHPALQNIHAPKTLTIRKVGGTWYFFIDRTEAFKTDSWNLYGNQVGFKVSRGMAIEIDYLKVSRIRGMDQQGPEIVLLQPTVDHQGKVIVTTPYQTIKGKVSDMAGVKELKVNGKPAKVNPNGEFEAFVSIAERYTNTVQINLVAKDFNSNISTKAFQMYYEKPKKSSNLVQHSANAPTPNTPAASPPRTQETSPIYALRNNGRNYLLVIGVNTYSQWNPLHNAVKDCNDLSQVLTEEYTFDKNNVFSLYNHEATRENILEMFERLQKQLGPNDNLVIYYAGHGYYDAESGLGYWVPSNARLNKIPDYIRNSTIHDYLKTIKTKHTFLIADACFAGSLFAVNRGNVMGENYPSRWAFTSGNIERVWDGQPGSNSPFAHYLIRCLKENTKKKLYVEDLINSVKPLVERNTEQHPIGNPLRSVGDEGGNFAFRRRN